MNYRFNSQISALQPSASIALMDKARAMKAQGIDVISLAGGEPDFDTPEVAVQKGIRSILDGKTHYTAGRGIPALRERIAKKLREENGIPCTAASVLVTPGAKAAIYCAVRTLIDPGDEVMILDPSWVSYESIVQSASGVAVHVPLSFANGYAITKEALEAAVSERTRILIVNTPNNPTGRVMTQEEAQVISAFAQKYDLMVIADEIYEKILFDGNKHISLASFPEIADRVVTINGLSKCAAMTGWRLGYLTAAQEVVDQIYLFYQHVFTCVAEFSQEAAVAALDDPQSVEAMRLSYQQRRDSFVADLEALPGIRCIVPEGAFYAWAQIDYQGMDADAMSKFLLEQAHVVTVPGGAYGENSKNCIRMCFAADPQDLKEAVKRMAAVLKED